jgi:hypothetical protein
MELGIPSSGSDDQKCHERLSDRGHLMKLRYVYVLAAIVCLVCNTAQAKTYDAFNDFSLTNNPNGTWSYGYGVAGTSFTLYPTSATNCASIPGLSCWDVNPNSVPIVGKNVTSNPITSGSLTIPTGLLAIHPFTGAEADTIVEWTAPSTGKYRLSGFYKLLDTQSVGVTALIYAGSTQIFDQALTTSNPSANFSITQFLTAGETVQFAAGPNSSGGFFFDTTGFDATIQPVLSDPSEPGSIIVYQKFQRGFVTVDAGLPGQSVQPRSLIELGATCPTDDTTCGVDIKVVRVNFHWVCPPQPDVSGNQFAATGGGVCVENDFFVNLTVNGKVWFSPEGGTTSGDLPGQIVPQAPCNRGYLIGFVTNIGRLEGDSTAVFEDTDRPIRFDGLIGDAIMRNTPQDLQAFRAITIQADPGTDEESPLTGSGTAGPTQTGIGTLVLDGGPGNYLPVTGQLSGDVRYDSDMSPPFADSALIFLTLDVKSNQNNTPTYVNLVFYNAQQQGFSEALSFICWGQINITTIDASLTQEGIGSARGLFITSQAYNPNSVMNPNGTVTLLGAVQITEGPTPGPANATRSYTVPVFDNSVPIATKYLY